MEDAGLEVESYFLELEEDTASGGSKPADTIRADEGDLIRVSSMGTPELESAIDTATEKILDPVGSTLSTKLHSVEELEETGTT